MSDIIWYYHATNLCDETLSDMELYGVIGEKLTSNSTGECFRCDCYGSWSGYFVDNNRIILCIACHNDIIATYNGVIARVKTVVVSRNGELLRKRSVCRLGWQFSDRDIRRFVNAILSLWQSELNGDIVNYIVNQLLWSYEVMW